MDKKRNLGYVLMPLMLCIGLIGGTFLGKYLSSGHLSPEEEKLRTLMEIIRDQYVDEIDADSLLDKTIPDILAQLDPHTVYIPKEDLQITNDDLESSFGGVGVAFQMLNDTVNVIEVIAGGPSEKVGILPGDQIIEANGKKLSGAKVTTDQVFSILRGKEGTKVELNVKRASSKKPLKFEVIRDQIPSNSVDASYMMDNSIGYVRVSKFARNTYNEFFSALTDLQAKGAKKFIVDLRGNSGGFMDQAILMANEFLPAGKMIVYTKGRTPDNEMAAVSDGNGQFQNSELVVLTNEYSASASEIFAGAIQDNDRGLIIGRRSFGKGLVQNQIALPDSSAIRLTVARYYTPSGRSIQKEYTRGKDGKYEMDIVDRYNHGEFYSQDSIKFDKSKTFKTAGGRTVYGGGGIMPDVFVPEDTTYYTSYYIEANNLGLIQKYAHHMSEKYRDVLKGDKNLSLMLRVLPREQMLLTGFVDFASANGLPSRWYYINKSKPLLINQLQANLARDLVNYEACIEVLNQIDPTISRAVEELNKGASPVKIKK